MGITLPLKCRHRQSKEDGISFPFHFHFFSWQLLFRRVNLIKGWKIKIICKNWVETEKASDTLRYPKLLKTQITARKIYIFLVSLYAKGNSFRTMFCRKHSQCIYTEEYLLTGYSMSVSYTMLDCTYIHSPSSFGWFPKIRTVLFRI